MTLLRDLISIPERVHQGDFVLKLSEGVLHPDQTLRDYVVTPQLADAFRNALGFIQQAVTSGSSKAAYLHGSFGSGKSHFMAVLNLLLAGNTKARAIPELADAVAQATWTQGRKFLMVPYHMIGERDMESAILGQYADHVRQLHADAPIPGFYQAERLFQDAKRLHTSMGDATFFAQLNEGRPAGGGGGWGRLDAGWEATSFESAMLEPPNGEERVRLVGDLISRFFSAVGGQANTGESYLPLDDGLAIMSRHAKDLGYDAVILFLDELVLWLASHAADVNFVSREGTKLVKLVEATNADRPIPLVSFVARQRDLRELVGDNLPGAIGVQFTDVLRHWEARFHRITLEDRNLPAIAEKRVLRPLNEAARQTLATAFEGLQLRPDVRDTLLTGEATLEMFRKVYPFSPALVQTLIAVSAALQRERTALKLMMQLLVDRRNDLELGQLIPVGDLWDAIVEGDEPFSEAVRLHFENAKRLYNQRLLPMIEMRNGTTWEAIRLGQADPTVARALRNDARLLKTLLLAALVPEVDSLKALTGQRLAALNHGTFRAPIPGQEAQQVMRKIRDWAGEVGEIKVTDDTNPLVSIQITGVDLEPVLLAAASNDNPGNRKKKIRELLFEQLGVEDRGQLFLEYQFNWRGTPRTVELLYENVREMADDRLRGRPGAWTVVLDFPFDEPNRTPADDQARLNEYRGGATPTLVWLPSFLGQRALNDLGRYVTLDYILQGERFDQYATHLTAIDRAQAKSLARNQRDSLCIKLRGYLDLAYGIATGQREVLSHVVAPDQQFRSLDPTLSSRPPVGADLKAAFEDLLKQLFAHQYPAHPEFDTEIKVSVVKKVWQEVRAAAETDGQRGLVSDAATRRLVRSIVNPLKLGQMGETHLLVETHWQSHFTQRMAQEPAGPVTVGRLRRLIDQPRPMGLPLELQNLLILTFAAQTNRRLVFSGPEPDVDRLPDEIELREQTLPSAADWQKGVQRAAILFGLVIPESLNAANVGGLVVKVKEKVAQQREPVAALVRAVADRAARYAPGSTGERQRTAESAQALLAALAAATEQSLVAALAGATVETTEAAAGKAIAQSQQVVQALSNARWELFDAVRGLADQRQVAGQQVVQRLAELLRNDEHVIPLQTKLNELERDAIALLSSGTSTPPPSPPSQAPPPLSPGKVLVEEIDKIDLDTAAATAVLDQLKTRLQSDPELELSLHYRLQKKGRPL
ncbi:MAG: phage resistance protein [Pseudomonadota bacterium]